MVYTHDTSFSVIFGGMIGYSGDDINKFLWMVRIAEGEHPQEIQVRKLPRPPQESYNFSIMTKTINLKFMIF